MKLRFLLITLVATQLLFNVAILQKTSVKTEGSETTVYKTERAIPGPVGLTGASGQQGLSIVGPEGKTVYNQVPIVVQGQAALPCTVDAKAIICPDGSSTVLPIPVDGLDGADGQNGLDGRNVYIYKNERGDVVREYDGDTQYEVLIRACEYKGNCDGS